MNVLLDVINTSCHHNEKLNVCLDWELFRYHYLLLFKLHSFQIGFILQEINMTNIIMIHCFRVLGISAETIDMSR